VCHLLIGRRSVREKDDESFRLPFSKRLDSTGHQAKGKLLYGASAPCPIDSYASLLIENHRSRFSFRSDRSIADSATRRVMSRIARRSLRTITQSTAEIPRWILLLQAITRNGTQHFIALSFQISISFIFIHSSRLVERSLKLTHA